MFVLPTYSWRGKTYKSLTPLCRSVMKKYPTAAVSFDRDFMYVRWFDGIVIYRRTFDAQGHSIIADAPEAS